MIPFERWSQDVQALLVWHGLNPSLVSREDMWRMYQRGDSAIEVARLTANIARQVQEMARACRHPSPISAPSAVLEKRSARPRRRRAGDDAGLASGQAGSSRVESNEKRA
jgi:predicted transcriptional regulator